MTRAAGREGTSDSHALEQFLGRHRPVGGWEEDWAGIPLRFKAYLAGALPPAAYVGSVRAIVCRGGDVLVMAHGDQGKAAELIFGGRPEPGEALLDALLREVAEETGWRVTRGPVVGFIHAHRTDPALLPGPEWRRPDPDFLDPIFVAEAVSFDPASQHNGEPPVHFLPAAEAASLVHPLQRTFLERALAVRSSPRAEGSARARAMDRRRH